MHESWRGSYQSACDGWDEVGDGGAEPAERGYEGPDGGKKLFALSILCLFISIDTDYR